MPRRRRPSTSPSPPASTASQPMAFQHQFHSRLLQQVNDTNSRNLELQSLIAQKDDQIASLTAQLQHPFARANNGGNATAVAVGNLQRLNADLTISRDAARRDNAALRSNIEVMRKTFDTVKADLNKQIESLQSQLKKAKGAKERGKSSASKAELDTANNEVKRLRLALAALQKQFEAEKREAGRGGRFPATAPDKMDQDDEENLPAPRVKSEPPERILASRNEPSIGHPSGGINRPSSSRQPIIGSSPSVSMPPPPAKNLSRSFPASHRSSIQSIPSPVFSTTHRPRSAPTLKRSASLQDSARPRPAKRPRSEAPIEIDTSLPSEEEATSSTPGPTSSEDEGSGSGTDSDHSSSSKAELRASQEYTPRKSATAAAAPRKPVDTSDLRKTFEFKAVTSHHLDGSMTCFDAQEDLSDECDELWEAIRVQVDQWEEARGECWKDEFEHAKNRSGAPCCVTAKLNKIRTFWRAGAAGKYACRKCVEEGRPCFAWNGEEFWLLPLHDGDRKWPVKEGFEIRYWLDVE